MTSKVLFFISFLLVQNFFAQVHKWKPIEVNDSIRIWYDSGQIDTLKATKFEVWILELYKPMISMEGINEKIMRAKTLYAVDLENFSYGIKKIVYYDSSNREIVKYDYDIDKYPDEQKYSFPILQNSVLDKLILELRKQWE